jgi:4Fe-4S single cluster domain of Ferredoxin I
MNAELQTQIAFHLAGRKPAAEDAGAGAGLRPALLARYRDLSSLRYDFPLVLARGAAGRDYAQCLAGIVDEVVHRLAGDDAGDRLTRHLLALEREIRVVLAGGARGQLSALWDEAAGRLAARGDESLREDLARARKALKVDGELVDCDESLPGLLAKHAWGVVRGQKTRKLGEDLRRLTIGLSNILQADAARSAAGRSPESLKAAVGAGHAEVFDFGAMSRLLARNAGEGMPARRRRRIESLLAVLESQRFVPLPGAAQDRCYAFAFGSCADALAAYRERLPEALELARSLAVAELEARGEYREEAHDALFADFGGGGLGREALAQFPDYLVCVPADRLQGAETDRLMELLSAGLPVKVLVQSDDLLEESTIARDGHFALGMRARQLASMALGLNDAYVLQSSASNLFQFRERILAGMSFSGPALFSVYSGAPGAGGPLPPYLVAAAAMESRAFPAYSYDPSAGANWAARFDLEANTQVEADWPAQEFFYEDQNHQRVRATLGFTFADFVACDPRQARHFDAVTRAQWNESMVPLDEFLRRGAGTAGDAVPYVSLVDGDGLLRRAVVDEALVRAALRCRESWHSLQELGGIHNSHAERLLAKQAKAPERAPAAQAAAPAVEEQPATQETTSSDAPYIETPRCTSCNECTQINDKMFAYNENKQAYVANPDAGTYAQLVEAAESCQVSIIHPGKPRNPAEPGLAELLVRAEAFA